MKVGPLKKSGKSDKLNLAGLLNVLDGVVDTPGRIVIMTSNHPEKLDPALIRPGRINKRVHLGYVDFVQCKEMVEHYLEISKDGAEERLCDELLETDTEREVVFTWTSDIIIRLQAIFTQRPVEATESAAAAAQDGARVFAQPKITPAMVEQACAE